MAFQSDPELQIQRIRANLAECPQTSDAERTDLAATIDTGLLGSENRAKELTDVRSVQDALHLKAGRDALYFQGIKHPVDDLVWHTRREDKLIRVIQIGISASDPALSTADSIAIASEIVADLAHSTRYSAAKIIANSIPLHRHGTPMWIAVPGGEDPPIDGDVHYLPARLGLQPEDEFFSRYLLVLLDLDLGAQPRFADSEGYAYWKPGGLTDPIEGCPADYTGLTELVVDEVRVNNIAQPLQPYLRIF